MQLPNLVQDLALILATASISALIFRALKQPVVLGYLVAGIFVGPHISFHPTLIDPENVRVWGELGVVFVLFVLGLEFSFKKLLHVGRPALLTAVIEVSSMVALGFSLGMLLGWSVTDSLFLGATLSISSTMIIVKTFQEVGAKAQYFTNIVFGVLVLEDLFAILMLVVLSTLSLTKELEGAAILGPVRFLVGSLVVTIPLGLYLFPRLFRILRPWLNDETRIIFALGLCFSFVWLSTTAGFSAALGAFVVGALIGETAEGERIERFIKPIRDLFAAIFFVSMGSLLDFHALWERRGTVVLVAAVLILGKIIFPAVGMLVSGQTRKTAFQTGLSLAQIGEFSFIIAGVGMTLGVVRPELLSIIISVSILTAFAAPYLIGWAVKLGVNKVPQAVSLESQIWDGHLVELEIHPHSRLIGKTLDELRLRENLGVSVISIHRGDRKIIAPTRSDQLMSYDRIIVLGTEAQVVKLEDVFQAERFSISAHDEAFYDLLKLSVPPKSSLIGVNLRNSGIREKFEGLVVGIERQGQKILNPNSTTTLQEGDLVWLYARRDLLHGAHQFF